MISINNGPRCPARIALGKHIAIGFQILQATRPIAIVFRPCFPTLPRIIQARLQPLVLLICRHMHKNFDERCPHIALLGLKLVNRIIGALTIRVAAQCLNTLYQNTAVPAPVKHTNGSPRRHTLPKAP